MSALAAPVITISGARLLMADYPDHPAGAALLQKVQRAANEAQAHGQSEPVALASGS